MKRSWWIGGGLGAFLLALLVLEYRQISATPVSSFTTDHQADCGVVLTGGPARIREGIDLLAKGSIRLLIISGVHPNVSFRDIFPQWPFHGSVDENSVILEKRSTTTFGNAQQTLALVEALRCRDLVLVTSQVHMHRAARTFRAAFPEGFPIQERATVSTNGGKLPLDEVLWEALKSVFYWPWAY